MGVNGGQFVPVGTMACEAGYGIAASPALGLLVTSRWSNVLDVFVLPVGGCPPTLAHVCTLGGDAPMLFKFVDAVDCFPSGYMAFATDHHLLVLTDVGHGAVHVIDVVAKIHVGFVAAPGTIAGPRGVTAKGSLVAVSAWSDLRHGEHVVRVYEGTGAAWALVRVLAGRIGREDGVLSGPAGLRFTADGTGLVVADSFNNRVSLFCVQDGSFKRHVGTDFLSPQDVQECEGGWLVACGANRTITFVDGGTGQRQDLCTRYPSALAMVPGPLLIVRERGTLILRTRGRPRVIEASGRDARLKFFATHDAMAMAAMSTNRVAWMGAAIRAK